MTNIKKSELVEISACRGINMHFEWGPWLNLSLIHTLGWAEREKKK
jgi:hypothetical protein